MRLPIFLITYDKIDRLNEFMSHWNENIDDSTIDLYICDNKSNNSEKIRERIRELYAENDIAGYMFFDENIIYNAGYYGVLNFAGKEPVIGIFEDDRPFREVDDPGILYKARDFILNNDDTISILMGRKNSAAAGIKDIDISKMLIDVGKITGSFLVRRREYIRYSKQTGRVLCKWGGGRYVRQLGMKSYKINCVSDYGYGDNTDWAHGEEQHNHTLLKNCNYTTHLNEA